MTRLMVVVALTVLMAAPVDASSLRSGDIFAVTFDGVIIRIDPATGSQTVVASGGLLANTQGIAVSPWGEVFVVQSGDTVVRVSPFSGEQSVVSTEGLLFGAFDITIDRKGDLFLPSRSRDCLSSFSHNVVRVDPRTGVQSVAIDCPNDLVSPFEIEATANGLMLLLLDFELGGSFGGVALFDPITGLEGFQRFGFFPRDFAVAPNGDIFVVFFNIVTVQNEIFVFDSTGSLKGVLPARGFFLIQIDAAGNLIGASRTPEGIFHLSRVDLQTGQETFLASIAGELADMTIVPPVPVLADAFIRSGPSNTNEGANPRLRIQASGNNRAVVGFDLSRLDLAAVSRATLVLTIAENADNWGQNKDHAVDAHPLLMGFTEGNGKRAGVADGDAVRGSGPGVTWNCASDANLANQKPDCRSQWGGGNFGVATAPPVLHANGQTGEVAWEVTADLQAGATGWLIKKRNEVESGQVTYYSKEGAAEAGNAFAARLLLEWR